MTLDEAIKQCEEKAKELSNKAYEEWGISMSEEEAYNCNECAMEHEQLAKWLKELKARRKANTVEQPDIVFLCDKQIECGMTGDCGIMCKHTHNIQHAVNFERIENTNGNVYYFEKERGNT